MLQDCCKIVGTNSNTIRVTLNIKNFRITIYFSCSTTKVYMRTNRDINYQFGSPDQRVACSVFIIAKFLPDQVSLKRECTTKLAHRCILDTNHIAKRLISGDLTDRG